jgi:hypothetical protein
VVRAVRGEGLVLARASPTQFKVISELVLGSQGSGLRAQGSGFRVQGSGFRVQVRGQGTLLTAYSGYGLRRLFYGHFDEQVELV